LSLEKPGAALRILLWFSLIAALAGATALAWIYRPAGDVEAVITNNVLVAGVKPFGVNLGNWTFWGAEQLSANVLKNPGFEGLIDGAIVIPTRNSRETFNDSPDWLAREDGFWEGATYRIRAGQAAGKEGRIVHSLKKGPGGLPSFTVQEGDPVPDFGSAVAVVKTTDEKLPAQWWYSRGKGNSFSPALGQVRPGSPGKRSLRVGAAGDDYAEVASYFDTIANRGGKMLPLNGDWKLSFWARVEEGNASLKVLLRRGESVPFLATNVSLSREWKKVELTFRGKDDGPADTVSLRLRVSGEPEGHILVDDIDLRKSQDVDKPFRSEVVEILRSLHPWYLRDWEGQLGDTLENRIAPAFARRSYRYRPGTDDAQTDFGYGIGDFLDLARDVGAAPWIIVPPTFSDAECAGLGDYLVQRKLPAGQEVMVEFANESWNDLFRPAGIPDPYMYSQAADRCFAALRSHVAGLRVRTVIGTQFANPNSVAAYAAESHGADVVAVAPYFAYSIPAGLSLNARIQLLFEPQTKKLSAILNTAVRMKKELAVYEVNLHSSDGDAPALDRVPLVAGMASGSALAKTMLDVLAGGVRNQCVYTLSGYDAGIKSGKGFIPLWGVVRDLGVTNRLRPTGLALQLMNDVLRGNMLTVTQHGPRDVSLYAFSGGPSVIAVSGSSVLRRISLELPAGRAREVQVFRLAAPSLASTNESGHDVRIAAENLPVTAGRVSFELAPWSMAVLTPVESPAP
jgi:hypothetical protein